MKNTMKKPVAIPVEKLRPFAGHPFKVKDDEEMNTLIESIQTQGILSPLIVRPIVNTDKYEVVSGHRRLHAAQKAGITEVPALIYALDRDAAAIQWRFQCAAHKNDICKCCARCVRVVCDQDNFRTGLLGNG